MTTLFIGNQTLDYTELARGDGQDTLIFLHGIVSSQYSWLDFPLAFARYGRVLTLTLPGHYPATFAPEMPEHEITDSWVGDTIAEAVRQLTGGQPAVLIGHSTGGYASLATAWRAPALVKAAISLAGFVHGKWTNYLGVAQRLQFLGPLGNRLFDAFMFATTRNPVAIDWAWQQFPVRHGDPASNLMYRAFHPLIMSHMRQIDPASMRKWFYQMYRVADLSPHLPAIQAPVLALAGTHDHLVPTDEAVCMGTLIPHGQHLLLDHTDHFLYMEHSERVKLLMCDWLDRIL